MILDLYNWGQAVVIYNKIWKHYGLPPGLPYEPTLVCYYDPDDSTYGWWDGDEIRINFACTDLEIIIKTMIHEIWHCFQEEEADFIAERDWKLFL